MSIQVKLRVVSQLIAHPDDKVLSVIVTASSAVTCLFDVEVTAQNNKSLCDVRDITLRPGDTPVTFEAFLSPTEEVYIEVSDLSRTISGNCTFRVSEKCEELERIDRVAGEKDGNVTFEVDIQTEPPVYISKQQ